MTAVSKLSLVLIVAVLALGALAALPPPTALPRVEFAQPVQVEVVDVDWNLPPLLDANIWFSLRHPESQRIIQSLLELARQNGGKLPKTGDGRSNGSIRIYAGVNSEGIARVAILHIVSSNVSFSVVQASAMSAGASCVAGGCFRLGGDQFIDPKRLTWSSAWIIADKVRNGHGSQPMESWLTVDQGWARWAQIQAKYSLYIELAEIPLPPSPF